MPEVLLQTKLYIPPLRPNLVPRPRLIERLHQGLQLGHKLSLISAPAGFGKTTLVTEWLSSLTEENSITPTPPHPYAPSHIAWLSLDKADNDPFRFLTYLTTALQTVEPDIGINVVDELQAPGVMAGSRPSQIDSALTILINNVANVPNHFIIVLDDYHLIEAPPIHEAVSFLVDHQPPQMHLVIATRADPPLPIARLRGQGQLTEVHAAELSFTLEEVAAFLNEVMGLGLSADQVGALERRTEGWIAGLQLAALSMQGHEDVSGFIQAFTGSHRYILDYLTEEVLNRQPVDIQAFLKQTAILDRLTGPLCDAVIGGKDSQRLLEKLETANLFIVALDEERRWYRYHHLFADLLRQYLQRERRDLVPELHRRASHWHEENGLVPEAVSHALAAEDFERAASLIEHSAWTLLTRGEMITLLEWLQALPADIVRSQPQLGVFWAWALALTGQWAALDSCLAGIDIQRVPGEVAAVQAYITGVKGDVPRTIELAQQALEQLPEEDLLLRGNVALSQGIAYFSSGEPVAASQALIEAIKISQAAGQTYLTLAATATLGHVQETQGLLRQSVKTHQAALKLEFDASYRPIPFVGMAYVGLAEVLYEWNDLDGALHHATKGVKLLELGGFLSYLLAGYARIVEVHQARADFEGAAEVFQKLERLAHKHEYAYMIAEAADIQVRQWLTQGNPAAAVRWARKHRLSQLEELSAAQEIEQIAVAWALIAWATSRVPTRMSAIDEASSLLAQLLKGAEKANRMGRVVRILALQALAYQAQGAVDQALSVIERALSLAEPEGYVRTFVDEGQPMARLLYQALTQEINPEYTGRLLASFPAGERIVSPASLPSQTPTLVEPLTERELEVLHLIAAGLSNQEIAQDLVVAKSTVKSHINHIYGKLGVKSRTQALAQAQALGLL